MNFIVAVPILVAGAAGLWWLGNHSPKGVLIVIGVILHVAGRIVSSQFRMVFGPGGERLDSLANRLIADLALPLQILGVIAVIHGIIILFKKKTKE
jgi:hypothetical protein